MFDLNNLKIKLLAAFVMVMVFTILYRTVCDSEDTITDLLMYSVSVQTGANVSQLELKGWGRGLSLIQAAMSFAILSL